MKTEIILRKLTTADLPQIARVHINSFPDSALTKLGAGIVERYYRWQLTGPHEKVRAVGAFIADECVGFSFSGVFDGSTSGFIRQNRVFLVKEVLRRPQLFFNQTFLGRLREGVRLLTRFAKKKPASTAKPAGERTPPNYGILSIAVSQNHQKSGIGQLLMRDAETEAYKYGFQEICLTVHPENKKAVRFYEKQNWQKFTQSGLWRGAMTKSLKQREFFQ